MHGWETRMLLKHYLERGVSKTELSRRFEPPRVYRRRNSVSQATMADSSDCR